MDFSVPAMIARRISDRMKAVGLDQPGLAAAVGCSQGAISQILTGRTTNSRFLPKIAQVLGVSFGYLVGTTEDPTPNDLPAVEPERLVEKLGLTMIPEVDIAYSMGGGSVVGDYVSTTLVPFRSDWLRRLTRGGPADVFLSRGEGDSMMPTILDGDDVLVNRADRSIRHQDKIWALGYGELGQIKRVRRLANGAFQLNSDNPNVTPIEASEDELFIVGRVIWVGRRM